MNKNLNLCITYARALNDRWKAEQKKFCHNKQLWHLSRSSCRRCRSRSPGHHDRCVGNVQLRLQQAVQICHLVGLQCECALLEGKMFTSNKFKPEMSSTIRVIFSEYTCLYIQMLWMESLSPMQVVTLSLLGRDIASFLREVATEKLRQDTRVIRWGPENEVCKIRLLWIQWIYIFSTFQLKVASF